VCRGKKENEDVIEDRRNVFDLRRPRERAHRVDGDLSADSDVRLVRRAHEVAAWARRSNGAAREGAEEELLWGKGDLAAGLRHVAPPSSPSVGIVIGLLARETILLRRAYSCEHDWKPILGSPLGEEQCIRCTVIVTPEGKAKLARAAAAFHGQKP